MYDPSSEGSRLSAPDEGARRRPALSRGEALKKFPIGTKVIKPLGDGRGRAGRSVQIYDTYSPYWRVRFADNDWEKLTASEMRRFWGVKARSGMVLFFYLALSLSSSVSPSLPPW